VHQIDQFGLGVEKGGHGRGARSQLAGAMR